MTPEEIEVVALKGSVTYRDGYTYFVERSTYDVVRVDMLGNRGIVTSNTEASGQSLLSDMMSYINMITEAQIKMQTIIGGYDPINKEYLISIPTETLVPKTKRKLPRKLKQAVKKSIITDPYWVYGSGFKKAKYIKFNNGEFGFSMATQHYRGKSYSFTYAG